MACVELLLKAVAFHCNSVALVLESAISALEDFQVTLEGGMLYRVRITLLF